MALAVVLASLTVFAAQQTTFTQRQVRDPRQLETILEANAADVQTRVAYAGGSFNIIDSTQLVFIATATNGVAISPSVTNVLDVDITN